MHYPVFILLYMLLKSNLVRLSSLVAGLATLSLVSLSAQEDDDAPGEIYQLSPFTVDASEDVGYRSTNTTSGTSLNTAIKDIPMSIEVINAEFLTDIGATNFEESLAYSSGVFLDDFSASTGVI